MDTTFAHIRWFAVVGLAGVVGVACGGRTEMLDEGLALDGGTGADGGIGGSAGTSGSGGVGGAGGSAGGNGGMGGVAGDAGAGPGGFGGSAGDAGAGGVGGASGAGGGVAGAGGAAGAGGGPMQACMDCLQTSCPQQWGACQQSQNCNCWEKCLTTNANDPQACLGQCGQPSGATLGLFQCAQGACQSDCMGGAGGAGGGTGGAGGGTGGFGGGPGGAGGAGGIGGAGGGPGSPVCSSCLSQSCSQQYAACASSQRCSCFLDCAAKDPSQQGQQQCIQQCKAQQSQALQQLIPCANNNCANECP